MALKRTQTETDRQTVSVFDKYLRWWFSINRNDVFVGGAEPSRKTYFSLITSSTSFEIPPITMLIYFIFNHVYILRHASTTPESGKRDQDNFKRSYTIRRRTGLINRGNRKLREEKWVQDRVRVSTMVYETDVYWAILYGLEIFTILKRINDAIRGRRRLTISIRQAYHEPVRFDGLKKRHLFTFRKQNFMIAINNYFIVIIYERA